MSFSFRVQDGPRECNSLPLLLRVFWCSTVAAFGLMVLIGCLEFRAGYPLPHYNPLGGSRFDDLLEYRPAFRFLHTASFYRNPFTSPVAYPPFAAVLFAMLYRIGHVVAVYLGVAALGLVAAVWGVRRALLRRGVNQIRALLFPLTIVLASFPIAGLLQRGNIELFLWIFALGGTWAYLRQHYSSAAILWALAAATKLYPIIFLILLIPRRQYRALALGMGVFVVSSFLSMWYLGPTLAIAWRGSLRNVFGYQSVRVSEWSIHEISANHSIFNLAKLGAILIQLPLAHLVLPYYACAALAFGLVFFGRLVKMPFVNQLLAVSTFMVMLPPISYFYTLVHLYAPLVLLVLLSVDACHARIPIRGLSLTIMLFVPLLGSFMLFTFPAVLLYGGLVQASILLSLFTCSVLFPFSIVDHA